MVLPIAALAGSVALYRLRPVALPVLAVVASALEVFLSLRIVHFRIPGVPLMLVLGGVLAVTGVWMLFTTTARWNVSAATLVGFVGVVQVLRVLGLH